MLEEENSITTPQTAVEEIIPGVILLALCPLPSSYTGVVAMVVAKGELLTVIDTGVDEFMPGAIGSALATLSSQLSQVNLIINTHGHFDHVGGNGAIHLASGAPVWAPAAETNMLEFVPEQLLGDGDEIDLGNGLVFEVISTPGHTSGSVCLYNRIHRLLIAADAIQGPGTGTYALLPVYFYSGQQYRFSLQRLLNLDVDTIVLGHPLNWSGQARCIHRGDDARRFMRESLDASNKIESAVRVAVSNCPDHRLDCIRYEMLQQLARYPLFQVFDFPKGLSSGANGTLRSELRDLGIEVE